MTWILWIKSILWLTFILILWLGGCLVILFLLKRKSTQNSSLKYSLISWIGILYLAILTIRIFKGDLKSKVITIKKFSNSWFKGGRGNVEKEIHYFKDIDDKVINLNNVLKKRQICLFSIQDSKILEKELSKISEIDKLDYYHIDLNYAFKKYYNSKESVINFWSQFSISLIEKLSKNPESKKTLIFLWTLKRNLSRKETTTLTQKKIIKRDEEEKYKIDHFVEIVETLIQNLRNFNILIITETDELLYYLKGTPLTRIMSVYKLTSHLLKLDENGVPYRNIKYSKNEQKLSYEEKKIRDKKLREKEKKREEKWAKYSNLKTKEEQEEEMLKDAKRLEDDYYQTQYQRERRIRDFKVNLNDEFNKKVIMSVLKGSKNINKNEWVAINQIPDFGKIEERFNYLVDRRVLERSGDVVKFINDDVFLYYNYELIGNLGDAIEQNLNKGKQKKSKGKAKKRWNWLVRFLWDLD